MITLSFNSKITNHQSQLTNLTFSLCKITAVSTFLVKIENYMTSVRSMKQEHKLKNFCFSFGEY